MWGEVRKNILNIGTIYYDNRNKKFSGGGNSYPERGKINLIGDIQEIYQYQGIDTPTEFISEEGTERDYYTKQETNNLLDKKQDKLIAGENIKIDENNKISATGGSTDLSDYYKKEEVNKKLEDTKAMFPIAFQINAINQEIPNLETTNKTVAGAINEINKKQPSPSIPQWKEVGTKVNINHIKYTFKSNTKYKIYYNFESQTSSKKFAFMCKEFLYGELNPDIQSLYWDKVNDRIIISLQMQNDTIAIVSDPTRFGQLLKLEELQE